MTIDDPRITTILSLSGSDRVTDRSRTVIRLAVESADEFSDLLIDSCHVLCGLLREGEGVASHILRSQFDVTRETMNAAMDSRPELDCMDATGIAADVKTVMESSVDFARRLNHSYLGTEHLLAGALSPDTASAALLTNMGIFLTDVEHEILGLLGHLS